MVNTRVDNIDFYMQESEYEMATHHLHIGYQEKNLLRKPLDLSLLNNYQLTLQNLQSEGTPTRENVRELGGALYQILFDQQVQDVIAQIIKSDDRKYRIRLIITPTELQKLPWEAMYDHRKHQYICTDPILPIVRHFENDHQYGVSKVSKLKILFVGAAPTNQFPLNVELIENNIRSKLDHQAHIQMDKLLNEEATRSNIESALLGDYQVLCFAGHGGFIEQTSGGHNEHQPCIFLWNEYSDDIESISAYRVEDLISSTRNKNLRLVVLLACRTDAQTQQTSMSFAQRLIRRGELPSVLAMQTVVDEDSMSSFAAHFFDALAQFHPVDQAMTEARNYMTSVGSVRSIIAPVLYLQADQSNLFRKAVNLWQRAIMIVIPAFIIIAVIFGIYSWQQNQALTSERLRADRALESQLQTLGQLSTSIRYNSSFSALSEVSTLTPSQPIMFGDAIWYLNTPNQDINGELVRQPVRQGVLPSTYPVGIFPSHLTSGGGYLWVTNEGADQEGTIMRVNEAGDISAPIPVGNAPGAVIANDKVAVVLSRSDTLLSIIDPQTLATQSISTPFNPLAPVLTEDHIWLMKRNDDELLRVDWDTGATQTFSMSNDIQGAVSASSFLWVLDLTSLHQIVPHSGEVINSVIIGEGLDYIESEDNQLWILDRMTAQIIQFDLQTLSARHRYDLPQVPSNFIVTHNRLWVLMPDDQVWVYNTPTGDLLRVTDIIGTNRVNSTTSDRQSLWLSIPSENQFIGLSLETGESVQELSICKQPTAPVYDGTNLWFACQDAQELIKVSSMLYYFGSFRFEDETAKIPPLIYHDLLWIVQSASGRLLAYDPQTNREIDRFEFDGEITDVIQGERYIWLIDEAQGILWQVELLSTSAANTLNLSIREHRVHSTIHAIHPIANHLWIAHHNIGREKTTLQENDVTDDPTLTILNIDTLDVVHEHHFAWLVNSLTVHDTVVWAGSVDWNEAFLTKLDATTGDVIGRLDLPYSHMSPWPGLLVDNHLWFTASAPTLSNGIGLFGDELTDLKDIGDVTTYIYSLNEQTETWETIHEMNEFVTGPIVDDHFLWYQQISFLPVIVDSDKNITEALSIYDTRTNSLINENPIEVCDRRSLSSMYVTQSLVLAGCLSPDTTLQVFSRQSDERTLSHSYSSMGSRPWQPLEIDDEVWLVFRDTNNLVVLDSESGDVLRALSLGDNPRPPVYYDGIVWVYNAGDGTLQRIDVDD